MNRTSLVICICWLLGCAGQAPAPVLPQPIAQGDSALHPGDVLRITVWRQAELSGEFVINPDSTVAHPLLQVVKVGGVPLSWARARLRDFLLAYEQNPRFVVEPLYPVVVAGEVRQPGLVNVPRGTTISQAVGRGGGPTERGRLDRVKLVRAGRSYVLNLLSQDQRIAVMPVMSGDQVFVARRGEFNVVRDALYPIASLTAAVAAILAYSRR
jgi:polysaccharide export outer membrane protein